MQLVVTVIDTALTDEYEWGQVANRVRNRIVRSARKPLDRSARLRIQNVEIDTAKDDDEV